MFSRRKFIISGTALAGFAVLNPALARLIMPNEGGGGTLFLKLSVLLTDKKQLNPIIAQRALTGLLEEDASFLSKIQFLSDALKTANIFSADELNNHPIMSGPAGDTAKKIISAWYLGYTGTPVPLRALDNTRFVSYTDAFAYVPTRDATVIPTYSRGKTDYWMQPPSTVNSD
jgi:hypothetical protein